MASVRGGGRLDRDTLAVLPRDGGDRGHRPLNVPLYLSSVWEAGDLGELRELFTGSPDRGFYTRFGHPTVRAAEEKVARLEGAEDALLFSSGMGAISSALYAVLRSADHVVAHRAIFGQTIGLLDRLARLFGVQVDFVDATDPAAVGYALRPTTRLVYLETPSNPLLDVIDVAAVSELARACGALVFVDSTFGGPLIQRPLETGADLSLQSASKSMGGHADLLAGSAAGSRDLVRRIREVRVLHGPILDPHAAWLLMRGLQTLPVRVQAQSRSAARLAELLERDPTVGCVRYPHLASHPGHEVARRQMRLGGAMVSFTFRGGRPATRRFVEGLGWIAIASSLGSVLTTIEVPDELDFAPEALGARADSFPIPQGLVRMSVGLEAYEDLEREIVGALGAVARGVGAGEG